MRRGLFDRVAQSRDDRWPSTPPASICSRSQTGGAECASRAHGFLDMRQRVSREAQFECRIGEIRGERGHQRFRRGQGAFGRQNIVLHEAEPFAVAIARSTSARACASGETGLNGSRIHPAIGQGGFQELVAQRNAKGAQKPARPRRIGLARFRFSRSAHAGQGLGFLGRNGEGQVLHTEGAIRDRRLREVSAFSTAASTEATTFPASSISVIATVLKRSVSCVSSVIARRIGTP